MIEPRDLMASATTSSAGSETNSVKPTKVPSALDIYSIDRNTKSLIGYSVHRIFNLRKGLSSKQKTKGLSHEFDRFSASVRPAVQGQFAAIGTDDPEAKENFLAVVNGNTLIEDARADPIIEYIAVTDHMADIKWLNATTILTASGKGNLKLFSFDAAAKKLQSIGIMTQAAGSYIREIAVQPGSCNNVVIGGFDQKLNFLDLNRPDSAYVQRLDLQGVIGSVKWSSFNSGAYVSCCLDEGKYYLFDARTAIKESSFYLNSKKFDLYTHERYNDFMVLLGYGDGTLKHFDMRKANHVLHTEQDPYVDAIGNIEYNQESNAIAISGYTDFSVWRVQKGECKIWSHSQVGEQPLRGKGWACSVSWYDSTTVVDATNTGDIGFYLQDFE